MKCFQEIHYDPLGCRSQCSYCICCILDKWDEASEYDIDLRKRCVCGNAITQNSVKSFKTLMEDYGSEEERRRLRTLCQAEAVNLQEEDANHPFFAEEGIEIREDSSIFGLIIRAIVKWINIFINKENSPLIYNILFANSSSFKLLILILLAEIANCTNSDLMQSITQKIRPLYFFWIIYKQVAIFFNDITPICLKSVLMHSLRITKRELLCCGFILYALLYCFIQYTNSLIYDLHSPPVSLIVLSTLAFFVANEVSYKISGEELFVYHRRSY
ncbi:unnamed protein product [Moneuplotes crassus]|uniref:Uncharacterized protein n=1 Tax=Euplotes crassus TaxID=5936 RepID=A0AAD1XQ63_EUPCR|nr:unnamed protein product [Moneuplotes crassus]